jgi:TfoX/Sxy family transcriptional regulator of competence genes
MAFDELLASRVRAAIGSDAAVIEKRMFGGLAFLASGNMSVGVHGNELIVRVDASETDALLKKPGVRIFDITGKPMKGWLLVAPTAVPDKKAMSAWVGKGLAYAKSLPPK